jgi:hypothetical protein
VRRAGSIGHRLTAIGEKSCEKAAHRQVFLLIADS